MKPRVKLAEASTPDGNKMVLMEHDGNFSITVDGRELMTSCQHESELELARLGCAHLVDTPTPSVLIGGLGMGYTLRQTLDLLGPKARIVVVELINSIVKWNRKYLGELNGHALNDTRMLVNRGNVIKVISQSKEAYDAILLDIDNGPQAMTDSRNRHLYSVDGITSCRQALRNQGTLAIWSAEANKPFERRLMSCGFKVNRYRVAAYAGSKSQSRFIWVASEDRDKLPPGGGEPRLPEKRKPKT